MRYFKFRSLLASAALTATLAGCTHFGTNVAGTFSCGKSGDDCQPVSAIDAEATRGLLDNEQAESTPRPRTGVAAGDAVRTGERTLRVVFPAHVDASGTLHEEAVAWAVIEAPRWAGELRRAVPRETSNGVHPLRDALRQAVKDAAREGASATSQSGAASEPGPSANLSARSPEHSNPPDSQLLFEPASPLALPSRAAEAAAGESAMSPTQHDRTPRPTLPTMVWPSAEAIDAAKSNDARNRTGTSTVAQEEPK